MSQPTHHLSLNMMVQTDQWDVCYRRFIELMREFSDTVPHVSINSYLTDNDEDGVEENGEYYDEFTLFKVVASFQAAGIPDKVAEQVIQEMQNRGILFREHRRPPSEENLAGGTSRRN